MGETKGKGSKSKGKGFKGKKGSQTSQASTGSGGKGPPNKKPASPGPKGSGKGNMNKGRAPILGRGSDRPHHGNFLTENQARSALAKARRAAAWNAARAAAGADGSYETPAEAPHPTGEYDNNLHPTEKNWHGSQAPGSRNKPSQDKTPIFRTRILSW